LLVATAAASIEPIVSPKADPYYRYGGLNGTKGFGRVKPREIYYGGDPTGLVCDIHSQRLRPSSRPSSAHGRVGRRTTG
jgi:hypothetical protein